MTNKDLLRELRLTIKELTDEKDELTTKLKSKESRIKQVLVQLEQSVDDVNHCGKKIREQEEEIKTLTNEIESLKGQKEENQKPVDDETEIQEQENTD
jgi:chromosome segregation ATPase